MQENLMTLWKSGIIGAVFSVSVNIILLFLLKPLTGVPENFMALSPSPVIGWSVIGIVGATIVYALLRKYAKKPKDLFGLVSFVVLLASFIPDVLILDMTSGPFAGATWGAVFLLMLMHVVVAGIVTYLFIKKTL